MGGQKSLSTLKTERKNKITNHKKNKKTKSNVRERGLVCFSKSEVKYQKILPISLPTEHQKHRIWIDHERNLGEMAKFGRIPTDFAMQIIGFIRRR